MVSEISILIPVYNQNVLLLVETLLQQAKSISIPFEILVFDDGSSIETLQQNRKVKQYPAVQYLEVGENIGRSKIRNILAQTGSYQWLLFLDNDMLPANDTFLEKYVSEATEAIAVGGVAYEATCPAYAKLRWLYGRNREQAPARQRQKNPYQRIFFSNLLVRKDLILSYFPHTEVSGYGHEDTLFSHRLEQNQIKVQHLDNPAYHLGLEEASIFLDKTEQAIHNLVRLQNANLMSIKSRISSSHKVLKKARVDGLLKYPFCWLLPLLLRNLLSDSPSLFVFDLYKLILFAKYQKR